MLNYPADIRRNLKGLTLPQDSEEGGHPQKKRLDENAKMKKEEGNPTGQGRKEKTNNPIEQGRTGQRVQGSSFSQVFCRKKFANCLKPLTLSIQPLYKEINLEN